MTLADLKPGHHARVIRINLKGKIRRRLQDMGVISGDAVFVKNIAALGDPLEIIIKNYSLSLRKNEAAQIQVEAIL